MSAPRYFVGRRNGAGFPVYRIERDRKKRCNRYTLIDYFPSLERARGFAAVLTGTAASADKVDLLTAAAAP
jgi:hypothetical protein